MVGKQLTRSGTKNSKLRNSAQGGQLDVGVGKTPSALTNNKTLSRGSPYSSSLTNDEAMADE